MAITNHERVGKALELLKSGLGPFVEREFKNAYRDRAAAEVGRFMSEDRLNARRPVAEWDVAALLKLMWESWNDVFRKTLGPAERSLLSELRDHRNKWAHQESFSSDDAYRALDSAGRLLTAVSAPQADEIEKMKMELLRLRFDEQVRSDPVVQLQTNFGGGKTHSMLALYHLFSGTAPSELAGVDAVMQEAGAKSLPAPRRVVLVGNKISPGNPVKKPDGTVVRTLWGELAWQLGHAAGGAKEAKKAFQRVAADDEKATSPGDVLRELFKDYGPCLVLIDEWVAYARQLHDQSDLPAGSFETQFTFAQALTESAKAAKNCLLVISLPASDSGGSPHPQTEDVEVGGIRGREALDRLRNVVGRLESSWTPGSAEEGFEIVRRRLFEPPAGPEAFKQRDVTARAFADLYRAQQQEFPPECRDADYEKRIKAAYPIHPEIFDRLYTDWSTLVKFQRTRGVLRLMAAVIHRLWAKGDRNSLILPATIPIADPRVQFDFTRYLSA